jgi:hypothetical protein
VLAQPVDFRPEMPTYFYDSAMGASGLHGMGSEPYKAPARHCNGDSSPFLTKMFRTNSDFVLSVSRDFVRKLPDAGTSPSRRRARPSARRGHGSRDARAERRGEPLLVKIQGLCGLQKAFWRRPNRLLKDGSPSCLNPFERGLGRVFEG